MAGVRDTDEENENYECHVFVWGSSQMGKHVHKDECSPSLVESLVETPVRQFESQLRDEDPECAQSLILNSNGQVRQFHLSQLSLPPSHKSLIAEKVEQIACGKCHCAAVGVSGSLFTWGSGFSGELGHGTADFSDIPKQVDALKEQMVAQVSCGSEFTIALTRDSAVYSWGSHRQGATGHGPTSETKQLLPRKIDMLEGELMGQVVAGLFHVAATTASGATYTWGRGGLLGHGDKITRHVPTLVQDLRGKEIVQLSCGASHTAAVTQTGLLYTFGDGFRGELGHGYKVQQKLAPKLVKDLEGVLQVSCGYFHTVARTSRGVYTWGFGLNGQLGHGSTTCLLVPKQVKQLEGQKVNDVVAFRDHTVALIETKSLATEDTPISKSYREMVNSETGADLKFVLEDGQVVFAHSCVLCMRSDYFESMLRSGMQESNKSSISIPNIRKEIFLLLLEYIYTGSVHVKIEESVELFMLADMHRLKKLQKNCLDSVEEELSVENAGMLLQSASSCNCEVLKKVCMDFVVKNVAAIHQSGNMKHITDVALCHEIIGKMAGSECADNKRSQQIRSREDSAQET